MKLQDFLIPIGLLYLTVLTFSYFWGPQESREQMSVRPGQKFTVQQTAQMCFPPKTEIDFYDAHKKIESQKIDIHGYNSDLIFSTAGAALESFIFKRNLAGVQGTIATLTPPAEGEREKGGFLIALNEMTPYKFTFVDKKEVEGSIHVVYEGETLQAKITKEFIVSFFHFHKKLLFCK